MNNHNSELDVAVFDHLIEGLADFASNPQTNPTEFFPKMTQVLEATLDPAWLAVVTYGSNSTPLIIHQTPGAKQSAVAWAKPNAEANESGLLVSDIRSNEAEELWGRLFIQLKSSEGLAVRQNVADAIAEAFQEFVYKQELKTKTTDDKQFDELLQFSINAHSSLDEKAVGYQLANDGRRLLGCERVSVFSAGGRARSLNLLAISSVASVEQKSKLIRNMKSMVNRAIRLHEAVLSDRRASDSRLNGLLETHLENTSLPFVFGVPIYQPVAKSDVAKSRRRPIGFLLAESTNEIDRMNFGRKIAFVELHAATSLNNARQLSQIPFRRPLSWLGRCFNVANISRLGIFAATVGLVALSLLFFKIDHKVRVPGELRPCVERGVYAPHDGIVEEVFVNHGDVAKVNDVLLKIKSPQIVMDLEQANGDINKLQKLKESKSIALNQVTSSGVNPTLEAQLASEVSDLDFQIATAVEKRTYLEKQASELQIVCPIDGEVTTWQVKESLTNKPVRWGEPLIEIANLDGEWLVVFKAPERRIGYILERAKLDSAQPVELEFFLDSNPSKKYRVPIVSIDQSAVVDEELGTVTLIKCEAPTDLVEKRQGAVVSGDVNCGKKSVWFVWTREMFDAIRRKFVW